MASSKCEFATMGACRRPQCQQTGWGEFCSSCPQCIWCKAQLIRAERRAAAPLIRAAAAGELPPSSNDDFYFVTFSFDRCMATIDPGLIRKKLVAEWIRLKNTKCHLLDGAFVNAFVIELTHHVHLHGIYRVARKNSKPHSLGSEWAKLLKARLGVHPDCEHWIQRIKLNRYSQRVSLEVLDAVEAYMKKEPHNQEFSLPPAFRDGIVPAAQTPDPAPIPEFQF
jgi:hypothetical protein